MTTSRPIYLDHAASSPLLEEAREAMAPFLEGHYANPSSVHRSGRRARRALDDARDELAAALGCQGAEIVFTSGGTEADNLAVRGVERSATEALLVSAVEHPAVLNSAIRLGGELIGVDAQAQLDLGELDALLAHEVGLVSVMLVNNEVGVIQPIDAVVKAVHEKAPRALVHTDAVQAFGWCDVASDTESCDLVSYSAHKFGGPRGIGALVVRDRARPRLSAVLFGGAQERELRPGTENLPGAVGMARAASITQSRRQETTGRIAALRDELVAGVVNAVPGATASIEHARCSPSIGHVRFSGIRAEELLIVLDDLGVEASAGSACASGAIEPSHVLLAMGLHKDQALEGVRFSLGPDTSREEITEAIAAVITATKRLGFSDRPDRRN